MGLIPGVIWAIFLVLWTGATARFVYNAHGNKRLLSFLFFFGRRRAFAWDIFLWV